MAKFSNINFDKQLKIGDKTLQDSITFIIPVTEYKVEIERQDPYNLIFKTLGSYGRPAEKEEKTITIVEGEVTVTLNTTIDDKDVFCPVHIKFFKTADPQTIVENVTRSVADVIMDKCDGKDDDDVEGLTVDEIKQNLIDKLEIDNLNTKVEFDHSGDEISLSVQNVYNVQSSEGSVKDMVILNNRLITKENNETNLYLSLFCKYFDSFAEFTLSILTD